MSDFPKYQISKFLDSKRDYQVVVRTDDFDELVEAMDKVKPLIEKFVPKNQPVDITDKHYEEQPRKCRNCKKANMVKNPKTGKWFCEDKCWLNNSKSIADQVPF